MNYYFINAMRLEGDLMSRGKEVKELREKMGMNRRELVIIMVYRIVLFKIGKLRRENFRNIFYV